MFTSVLFLCIYFIVKPLLRFFNFLPLKALCSFQFCPRSIQSVILLSILITVIWILVFGKYNLWFSCCFVLLYAFYLLDFHSVSALNTLVNVKYVYESIQDHFNSWAWFSFPMFFSSGEFIEWEQITIIQWSNRMF